MSKWLISWIFQMFPGNILTPPHCGFAILYIWLRFYSFSHFNILWQVFINLQNTPHVILWCQKKAFNVLIHQVSPLIISLLYLLTSICTSSFQSLYSVSWLCSRSRQCSWYGREATALFSPQRESVRSTQAGAAFLLSVVSLFDEAGHESSHSFTFFFS